MGQAIAFPAFHKWDRQVAEPSELPQTSPTAANPAAAFDEPGGNLVERLDGRNAFVAVSPAMREVRRQVEQVAPTDAAVLLLGESGTGKEVVARLIHKLSTRASRKFLRVNCAALPVDLLESELFGCEAGAFTGAQQARTGKFESCHRGTILLDEIGEMPISPQAKLLHVLQDGEFSRLGSATAARVDVRVLAATNVNVRQAVQAGTFRSDLYYRLNVFTIQLPPLRERREDLPHLLNYFVTTWAASYGRTRLPITPRILQACASYPWPGNIRELESFVKRYLVLGDESQALCQLESEQAFLSNQAAPAEAAAPVDKADTAGRSDLKSLVRDLKSETECSAILHALELAHGCKQEAAKLLGISMRAFHYKIRQYGIQRGFKAERSIWPIATARAGAAVVPEAKTESNETSPFLN